MRPRKTEALPSFSDITEARLDGDIGFREAVYAAVRQIPEGRVLGYGQVAALIGAPRAARQVGYALAALSPEEAEVVPWWRVIRSDGSVALQGDPARPLMQEALLEREGIAVIDHHVSMEQHGWRPVG